MTDEDKLVVKEYIIEIMRSIGYNDLNITYSYDLPYCGGVTIYYIVYPVATISNRGTSKYYRYNEGVLDGMDELDLTDHKGMIKYLRTRKKEILDLIDSES